MEWTSAISSFVKYLLTGFIMYGVFMVVERIRPAEPHQPIRDIWFNLRWYVLYSVVAVAIQAVGINRVVPLLKKWLQAPYLNVPTPNNWWQYLFAALLYFLAVDFFYYWFHRRQHKRAFFWEQHKFHHSETALNVTSTRRVHWLEDPLLLLFLGIPMGVLFNFDSLAIGILTFIEILWLQFIHMNLKLGFGKASYLLTSPQHHRIHHSFQDEHIDKNFAAFFPIWDILFGTYHQPQKNEYPPTGLNDDENYNNLWKASMLPFREWSKPQYLGGCWKKIAVWKLR